METLHGIYSRSLPDFLADALESPCMQRLRGIGMNCGCEYTAFPIFRKGREYTRYLHSIGVARIVWQHTGDRKQALAGLLHDVASPCFAHVIDFMNGDYLTQESTEAGTGEIIREDRALQKVLARCGISPEEVEDYHLYPIADNDSPRLSADRLEYTMGNIYSFGFGCKEEIRELYEDIRVLRAEDGQEELGFTDADKALRFGLLSLQCSRVYVSDADRYCMQMLSEIVRDALDAGVTDMQALYETEGPLVERLKRDAHTATRWQWYTGLCEMRTSVTPGLGDDWRRVQAKKRCINPLIAGQGRLSEISSVFSTELSVFREMPLDAWLLGVSAM